MELLWNGQVVDQGVAGDSPAHPVEGLAWIANHLAARGRAMAAGEIVIAGSALKTRFHPSRCSRRNCRRAYSPVRAPGQLWKTTPWIETGGWGGI
jgi:hypothetical protein